MSKLKIKQDCKFHSLGDLQVAEASEPLILKGDDASIEVLAWEETLDYEDDDIESFDTAFSIWIHKGDAVISMINLTYAELKLFQTQLNTMLQLYDTRSLDKLKQIWERGHNL